MIRAIILLVAAASAVLASSATSWEMNTFQDFSKGRLNGLSLSRDGRVTLAPKLESFFSSDQPAIWSVAQNADGSFYVGTGHRGRIYRVESNGQSALIWTAEQPEIFALATGPDGALYAGTSPDGKVFRITNGKATEYFSPRAKYIWSLVFGTDGALYVGTGDQGKVFRVARAGEGEVYYETGQSHITCLALDAQGRLLAGTEPNGILYQIAAKDKAFVLYDANLPEIRTIVLGPDGAIYAAALGGSVAQRTTAGMTTAQPGSTATPVTAPGTSITVTDEANPQSAIELKAKAESPKPAGLPVTTPYGSVVDMTGVEKSALYKINPDNTVETIWTSKEENAYDVLVSGGSVLFSTDAQGRIYRLGADKRLTLVAQTNEGETTRLLASKGSLIAATGTMGKLFRLGETAGAEGSYDAPVHDASGVARWGQLSWRADKPAGTQLLFRTRSGNSARPDRTWSDWSDALSEPSGAAMKSPNARFIQWRAELKGTAGSTPSLSSVTLSYLPQNMPPTIKSINVTTQVAAVSSSVKPAQAAAGVYSITVTDTGEAGASSVSGTTTQNLSRSVSQQIVITWQAEDPDGDRLSYALYFRGEGENQWKLLRSNFADMSLTLDGDIFADGKYYFRLVASDKSANPGDTAREAELISAPVLFDNTPPVVVAAAPRRSGPQVEIDVQAKDSASSLRRAEYSLDAMAWAPLQASDGIIDGREEHFLIRLDNLSAGEHLVVIRVFDSSNNAGLTKVLVQ
ncbi:MAG TPA: WD40 repeat domain-containing protein [Bryobacteraceae bacterium]|nr:WD40 repeat domain-containing protein [Bryobacteraceae bacterium]